jgi:ABC-type methionine transport system permease subunit
LNGVSAVVGIIGAGYLGGFFFRHNYSRIFKTDLSIG